MDLEFDDGCQSSYTMNYGNQKVLFLTGLSNNKMKLFTFDITDYNNITKVAEPSLIVLKAVDIQVRTLEGATYGYISGYQKFQVFNMTNLTDISLLSEVNSSHTFYGIDIYQKMAFVSEN